MPTAMFVIEVTALSQTVSQQINNTLFTDTKIAFIYTVDTGTLQRQKSAITKHRLTTSKTSNTWSLPQLEHRATRI